MSKPYKPVIAVHDFLVALDYAPAGEDFWVDPGDHFMREDDALECAGWPEAAKELDEEMGFND